MVTLVQFELISEHKQPKHLKRYEIQIEFQGGYWQIHSLKFKFKFIKKYEKVRQQNKI